MIVCSSCGMVIRLKITPNIPFNVRQTSLKHSQELTNRDFTHELSQETHAVLWTHRPQHQPGFCPAPALSTWPALSETQIKSHIIHIADSSAERFNQSINQILFV